MLNSSQEVAVWQFRSTSHGSSLFPLASNQSLFISLPPPASPSHVHGCGGLPTLGSWTCAPCLSSPHACQQTALREMWDSKRCVSAFCGFAGFVFLVQRPWKSPWLRIQMKCSKSGPKPLLEMELLSNKAAQRDSNYASHDWFYFLVVLRIHRLLAFQLALALNGFLKCLFGSANRSGSIRLQLKILYKQKNPHI